MVDGIRAISLGLSLLTGCAQVKKVGDGTKFSSNIEILEDQGPLVYPGLAETYSIAGSVEILMVVDTSGTADSILILKENPKGFGFAASAIAQAKSMRFKPATKNGLPARQKTKRRYNFEMPDSSRNGKIDTLTYEYRDSGGRRYSIRMVEGEIRSSLVYDESGEQLESAIWGGPGLSTMLYVKDSSILMIADSGREIREIEKEIARSRGRSWEIFSRHFGKTDTTDTRINIGFKISPSGEVVRTILKENRSRNAGYATEMIGLVSNWRFRPIKGNGYQWVNLLPNDQEGGGK